MVVTLDSLERASGILPALEGAAQGTSKEACASMEDGAPVGGPPDADRVVSEASVVETTIRPPL